MQKNTATRVFPANHVRIQTSFSARFERKLLNWLCARMPSFATPDSLTWTGVFGAFVVFSAYLASRYHPAFLWLANIGYLLNWFGDSLDGSLARHRGIEKPNQGYFIDHSADAISIFLIMAGLGFSGYVRMDAALFALVGYFMLCIYVFLSNHVTGRFQLSFLFVGPTELRLGLIALNILIYYRLGVGFTLGSLYLSSFDLFLLGSGLIMVVLSVLNTRKVIQELRQQSFY